MTANNTKDPDGSLASIDKLREQISEIDFKILYLLSRRRNCSKEIVQLKDAAVIPVRRQEREREVLEGLLEKGRASGLDSHFYYFSF